MPCSSWKKLSSILRRKLNVAWPAPVESNLKDSLLISAFLRLKFCTLNTSFSTVWLVLHDGAWCLNVCSPRVLGFLCSRMSSVSSEWMKFSYLAGSAPGDPQSPSNNKTLVPVSPRRAPNTHPESPAQTLGGTHLAALGQQFRCECHHPLQPLEPMASSVALMGSHLGTSLSCLELGLLLSHSVISNSLRPCGL